MIDPSSIVSIAEIESVWGLHHDKLLGRADPGAVATSAGAITVPNQALAASVPAGASGLLPGGIGGSNYTDFVQSMIRSVNPQTVLKRLAGLDAELRRWKTEKSRGQIRYQYSDVRELYFDLRAVVTDLSVSPTATDPATGQKMFDHSARLAAEKGALRVGMLLRFPALYQAKVETFNGQVVIERRLQADEDLHSVAAGAAISWSDLVSMNSLVWPYTSETPAPGVLVPGLSMIKVPSRSVVERRANVASQRAGGIIGIDFLRDRATTDLVSAGDGFLERVSEGANLAQSQMAQFNTPIGFLEEAPSWGAPWLRSHGGVGDWNSPSQVDLFYFHLARMVTFDGRIQSPDSIQITAGAGVTTMNYKAKSATGETVNVGVPV